MQASPRYRRQLPGGATPRRTGSVALSADPEPDPNIDVLNDFLPVQFDECATTTAFRPSDKLNTAILYLAALFRAYVGRGAKSPNVNRPVLLLIENAQDLDSASLRLMGSLLDSMPQLLIVLATRQWRQQRGAGRGTGGRSMSMVQRQPSRKLSMGNPQTFRSSSLTEWLLAKGKASAVVKLDPLTSEDVVQIAKNRLGVTQIPGPMKEALYNKSHGNPYFAEQLLQTWGESSELRVNGSKVKFVPSADLQARDSGVVGGGSTLPVGVQQVIMERVERLPWSQQITLRAASAVDGIFNIEILKRIHSRLHELGNDDIAMDLTQLCEMDLLEEVSSREDGVSAVPGGRRPRFQDGLVHVRGSVTLVAKPHAGDSRYEENDRFEGSLYDSAWDFKSATVRQTVYKALSKSQLKAAHWEVAWYREETLMKTVERRCRRHSSFVRTGSSPMSSRVVAEAREALKVMAARPSSNAAIQTAKVSAADNVGTQMHCVRIEFRRTGMGALLDHWGKQAIMLGAESAEQQQEWLDSLLSSAKLSPTEGDVQHGERLKQGWLNKAEGKDGRGNWTREWLQLLPGRLLSYKEPPALMLPQLNHYNAFRMNDNLPALAEHFIQAEDFDNAIKYLNYAGILALENDQVGESVASFSRATTLEQLRARKREDSGAGMVPDSLEPHHRARLERLKAEAYVAAGPEHPGSAPKALAHLTKALDWLSQPISLLPVPRTENAWQFPQLEAWFLEFADSPEAEVPDDEMDRIRCYLLLFELTRLNSVELCLGVTDAYTAAHCALQLSLEHHDPELVACSLAAACIATCVQGYHTASNRMADSASSALGNCTGSRCAAQVQLFIADYYVAICSWQDAGRCLDEAAEIFLDLGDTWRAAVATDGMRWVEHARTNFFTLAQAPLSPAPLWAPMAVDEEDGGPSGETIGEAGGQADHYTVVAQLHGARHAWSVLRACGRTASSRPQLCAELGSFLPAEFISDLLDVQLARDSHGLHGLLALCAAELAAIYAYWLMEDTSSYAAVASMSSPFRPPSTAETPGGGGTGEERRLARVKARTESYRVLVLASGLLEDRPFRSARALPALVAVAQGWARFVQLWGAGSKRHQRHHQRRHSIDHSQAQPPPSPVASMAAPPVLGGGGGLSLDADDPTPRGGSSPAGLSERQPAPSSVAKRRAKRGAARRLSVPDWRTDGDTMGDESFATTGNTLLSPRSDRATHSGVTGAHIPKAMVIEPELPRSKSRELELPTRIPVMPWARGDSSGSSNSDATPLLGLKSGPPPPSPVALAGTLGTAWAAKGASPLVMPPPLPGKATAEWSPGWSDPARDSVVSITSSGIGSLLPSVTSANANSRSAENSAEEEDVVDESTAVTIPHPGLASIALYGDLERAGLSATSSEGDKPVDPAARRRASTSPVAHPASPESPMLLRLKSEVADDSYSDNDEAEFDKPIVPELVPERETEPEPEPGDPTPRSMPPVPRAASGGSPQHSSQGTPVVNRERTRRVTTEDAAMAREAREARTQQLLRAAHHVRNRACRTIAPIRPSLFVR